MRNLLNHLGQQLRSSRLVMLGASLLLLAGGHGALDSPSAQAAEKVVLTYGLLGRSITLEDLETFVETGQQTPTLRFLINATDQDPQTVRQFLTREVKVSPKLLDNVLNILPGEYALFQVGRVLHTPPRLENTEALRSSIILSTVDDSKISVLEFLKNYPTRALYVDGYRLANTASDVIGFVNRVGDRLEAPLAIATDLLEGLVCDCPSPSQSLGEAETTAPTPIARP
ncbi:alpha/beta hydrolase [Lyngbya confervoides]|uniref:Alpha/beta hydrolase n=1 Tax=Lyngbya confervoides BDU141951 TaxID=1574623 RepID=A0ABD4SZI9_9CYAN|nr:alpha/beta hydrolase [Lyngbya confervoides]MCM1981570.1 alpha/beta hydrolase [Lyngbya confervoides BDU141951]